MNKLLVLFIFLLSACGHNTVFEDDGKDIQNLKISVGEAASVKIEENPTTGYGWEFLLKDEGIIKPLSEDYEATNSGLLGAGGYKFYRFEGIKSGTAEVDACYYRPWEKCSETDRHIKFIITVK